VGENNYITLHLRNSMS